MKILNAILLILGSWLFFTGCAPSAQYMQPPPLTTPTSFRAIQPPPASTEEGSLFNKDRHVSLFSDFRARHVGDVVTIVIEEDLKGSKDVKTQTQRKSEMNVGLTGLLDLEWRKRLEPRYQRSPTNAQIDASKAIGGSTTDKFDGSGKTSRDASLKGTVTARVIEVLPSGNLLIQGSRELRINNETQYLTLTGVVRPRDLGPDNTISSTRIADARIEYTGGGVLSEKQSPSWFARILGLMSPL